jgi:exodeoxyribonuclease VII large subunit
MIHILGRRFPLSEIVLYPALVQGAEAPASLVRGVRYFNTQKNADVLIIGRGGGSIEDLWAFNDETLVRMVAASEIPIISAVGHETDFTLCDFAADLRAPTPSAAAELAVPDGEELRTMLSGTNERLAFAVSRHIAREKDKLKRLSASRVMQDPMNLLDDKRMALLMAERMLQSRMEAVLAAKRLHFQRETAKLEALNPLSVVTRGYSAVFDDENNLIKSVAQINEGDVISFMLTDGTVRAEVKEIQSEKNKII